METVLDQSRDLNGREFHRLDQLYGAPEFVKSASVVDRCGEGGMQPHLYADQLHRLYPMHTAAATYTSAMFFYDNQGQFPEKVAHEIDRRLKASADFRGIRRSIDELSEKAAAADSDVESQLTDDDFAFIGKAPGGQKERRLRVCNAVEVQKAAEWLGKYRDSLEFRDRQGIAVKVLQKAARYGASIGAHEDMLEKVAGFGICSAKVAADLVSDRAKVVRGRDKVLSDELAKTAEQILAHPDEVHNPIFLQKLAETLDGIDRMVGVHRHYSDKVPRPEDVLFSLNTKVASAALESTISVGGKLYAKEDFGKIRTRDARDYLGDDFASQVDGDGLHVDPEKVAELIPTMPRPDQEVLDQLISSVGLIPFQKEAGAGRRKGFDRRAMIALAMIPKG